MDRSELAGFCQTRRAALRPSDVGLPVGQRRRTPGLRREEVARLAGMSVDYYTRLEQGRGPRPSTAVLDALARALRLDTDQRAHLFHLAGQAPPPAGAAAREVSPGVLHLLERLDDTAGFVLDASYDVLAWNPLAAALIADFSAWPAAERNLIWQTFCSTAGSGGGHYSTEQWEAFARGCVADLRASAARYPDAAAIGSLVARLREASETFARWWDEHPVAERRSMTKRIDHPLVGPIDLDCEVLLVAERDQRIILYTAEPGSSSHQALQLLGVVGTQDLASRRP